MRDPTIPRKGSSTVPQISVTPRIGWLAETADGGRILVDNRNNTWTDGAYRILQGGFGGMSSGIERAPRPFKYDAQGAEVLRGDLLLIIFLHNNPSQPVAIPGVRDLDVQGAYFQAKPQLADPNRFALRHAAKGDDGTVLGLFDIETEVDGQAAEIRVSKEDGTPLRLRLDLARGEVRIDQGGTRKALVNESLLGDLATALGEVSTGLTALGQPTVNLDQFVLDLAQPGYTTTKLTSE